MMKTSVINCLVLLGLLASEQVTAVAEHENAFDYANQIENTTINSCSKQESCIKILTYEFDDASTVCDSNCGSFKICVELDFNDPDCAKGNSSFPGANVIDYTCSPEKDAATKNHICNAATDGKWKDKSRKNLKTNKRMCQYVARGQDATFVFNDGHVCRNSGDDVASGSLSFSTGESPLSGVGCAASSTAQCCHKTDRNQAHCDNNIGKDCVWTIPAPPCPLS